MPADRASFVARVTAAGSSITRAVAAAKHNGAGGNHHLATTVVLRDYQQAGVQWLHAVYETGFSGILGLGKTLQSIAFVSDLVHNVATHGPVLVVVPLSTLDNWSSEFQNFAPTVQVAKLRGSAAERVDQKQQMVGNSFHVLLTTFESAISEIEFLKANQWTFLVVDEAHRLKNAASVLHQRLRDLNCPSKLLLTGTPVQNNLTELQALLSFACPDLFANDKCDFESWFGGKSSSSAINTLTELLKPFILRRVKEDVLELPKMKEVVVYAPLTKLQRRLYLSLLTKDWSVFDEKKAGGLRNILMQLRKCVVHPYLFDGVEAEPFVAGEHLVQNAGKMIVLDQLLKHAKQNGKRVLYEYERLDGSVRAEERFLSVNQFQSGGGFVFLLSTRAGGVGLNLTAADTVIFLDVDFNPTQDQQAAARVHRIGQTKPTTVIRIICPQTVDEVIWHRAQRKMILQSRIMNRQEPQEGHDANWTPKKPGELLSMLQFGIDKIVRDNEDSADQDPDESAAVLSQQELESIFDPDVTHKGDDQVNRISQTNVASFYDAAEADNIQSDEEDQDNIYQYQGKNFKDAAEAMEMLRRQSVAATTSGTQGRKRRSTTVDGQMDDDEESDEAYQKRLAERREQAEQQKRDRRFAKYAAHHYTSYLLDFDGVYYTASAEKGIKNLTMGSVHLIPLPNDASTFVALIVAQSAAARDRINMHALENGLRRIAKSARRLDASVHLPRIGHNLPNVDWYCVERTISKQ
eukprot:jgi/Hompol1/2929/HPOL_001492-RA